MQSKCTEKKWNVLLTTTPPIIWLTYSNMKQFILITFIKFLFVLAVNNLAHFLNLKMTAIWFKSAKVIKMWKSCSNTEHWVFGHKTLHSTRSTKFVIQTLNPVFFNWLILEPEYNNLSQKFCAAWPGFISFCQMLLETSTSWNVNTQLSFSIYKWAQKRYLICEINIKLNNSVVTIRNTLY